MPKPIDIFSHLSVVLLRKLLRYDADAGLFYRPSGKIAGRTTGRYTDVRVGGYRILSHRLAWFYVYGQWPVADIDHINGNTKDNRIDNLREATRSQNLGNRKINKNNKTGLKGVYLDYRGKYRAQITAGGNSKTKYIGSFTTAQEAHTAYMAEAVRHFGPFARAE
jgi:hypothetical protein